MIKKFYDDKGSNFPILMYKQIYEIAGKALSPTFSTTCLEISLLTTKDWSGTKPSNDIS